MIIKFVFYTHCVNLPIHCTFITVYNWDNELANITFAFPLLKGLSNIVQILKIQLEF